MGDHLLLRILNPGAFSLYVIIGPFLIEDLMLHVLQEGQGSFVGTTTKLIYQYASFRHLWAVLLDDHLIDDRDVFVSKLVDTRNFVFLV